MAAFPDPPDRSPPGFRPRHGGFTFVELMFATVLIVIGAGLLISQLAVHYVRTHADRDRVFAFTKARSILAEVFALSARGQRVSEFDDGDTPTPALSIETQDPAASGNFHDGHRWVWQRRIRVRPIAGANNHNLRTVTVTVAKTARTDREGGATLSTVVSAPGVGFPTTQAFDIYLVAIENIAGRGVQMESIRPFIEGAIAELEHRNPGLELRTHWITKASYGRDPDYSPEVAGADGVHAYRYPDKTALGASASYYYVANRMKGRVHVSGWARNGRDPNTNPLPYALADSFNHGVRLPRERAIHRARLAVVRERKAAIAAARAGATRVPADLVDMSEEPTWRLFLEDLNTNPDRYRNALILNLHGDVVPMPAIRNYSDAASAPRDLPGLRCVTHPEELRTYRDPKGDAHDPVVLRVYGYVEDPDRVGGRDGVCPASHAIGLRIEGLDLTDPKHAGRLRDGVVLEQLTGGVPITPKGAARPTSAYRPFRPALNAPAGDHEMYYTARFVDPGFGEAKYTAILLHNTPVTCPAARVVDGDRTTVYGLDPQSRLHGLEYIPSVTGPQDVTILDKGFEHDLSSALPGPKNTARWRLTIPPSVFRDELFIDAFGKRHDPNANVRITVHTGFVRVSDQATDQAPPVPPRESTTYTWWADTRTAVPITERSQFLGDPRHCPYKDVATGDSDFGDGYNWFFSSLRENGRDATKAYPGLRPVLLSDGWLADHRMDVPRYLALLRGGLLRAGASYGSLGDYGDARLLLGGERIEAAVARIGNGSTWRCKPWLGELCPDRARRPHWLWRNFAGNAVGNLPVGDGPDQYHAVKRLSNQRTNARRTNEIRWTWESFFNAESSGRVLGFSRAMLAGGLSEPGRRLVTEYRALLPDALFCARTLHWSLTTSAREWHYEPYLSSRCDAWIVQSFCDVDYSPAAALIELVADDDLARISINAIREDDFAVRTRLALVTLLHAHLSGGRGLLPRVELTAPTDTTEIHDPEHVRLTWHTRSTRWDGRPFALMSVQEPVEENQLVYVVLVSSDSGSTWSYALDPAHPSRPDGRDGDRETPPRFLRPDAGEGPETFELPTPPDTFPAGHYLFRVIALRADRRLHAAYHQRRIEITR